jgi:hypothetical protein
MIKGAASVLVSWLVLSGLAGCGSPMQAAELELRVSPSAPSKDTPITVVAVATGTDGKVGVGTVTFKSTQGSLVEGVDVVLDAYGTAKAELTCTAECTNPLGITARWNGVTATKETSFAAPGNGMTRCDFGTVTSLASPMNLSLFGEVLYFNGGVDLPAGQYRLTNLGGCMKYGAGQNWCVNAFLNGDIAWWVKGGTTDLFVAPGTFGFSASGMDVGFADFAACDAANKALPPKNFQFAGGKLGIYVKDTIYGDNTTGSGGNPRWKLSVVSADCP